MDLLNFLKILRFFTFFDFVFLIISSFAVPSVRFLFLVLARTLWKVEINLFPEEIDIFIQLLIWGIFFYILKAFIYRKIKRTFNFSLGDKIRNKLKYWKTYSFQFNQNNLDRFINEWEIQGNPILDDMGLTLTNTNSGILIKANILEDMVWKNFKATIDLSFKENKDIMGREYNLLLGIVFRAQSFENYFMLEIWKINDLIAIRPHVRVNGDWDAPIFNPKTNSRKVNQINTDFKFDIKVVNYKVELVINGNTKNPLTWVLPSEYEINLSQHPQKYDNNSKSPNETEGVVRQIPFRNMSGRFGFRNYGNEITTIKSLNVIPLDAEGKEIKKDRNI